MALMSQYIHKEEYVQLQRDRNRVAEQAAYFREEMNRLQRKLEDTETYLEDIRRHVAEADARYFREKDQVLAEKKDLLHKVKQLEKENVVAASDSLSTREKLRQSSKALEEKAEEFNLLKAEYHEYRSEREGLPAKVHLLEAKLQKCKVACDGAMSEVAAARDRELAALHSERSCREELTALQVQLEEATRQHASDMLAMERELDAKWKSELLSAEGRHVMAAEKAHTDVADALLLAEERGGKLQAMQTTLEASKNRIVELEAGCMEQRTMIDGLHTQVAELQAQHQSAQRNAYDTIGSLRRQVKQMSTEFVDARSNAHDGLESLREAQAALREADSKLHAAEALHQEQVAVMAGQHQTEVQRLGEELREQGAQFRQAQAEVQQLQALLSVARHDVERLRKQASSRANESDGVRGFLSPRGWFSKNGGGVGTSECPADSGIRLPAPLPGPDAVTPRLGSQTSGRAPPSVTTAVAHVRAPGPSTSASPDVQPLGRNRPADVEAATGQGPQGRKDARESVAAHNGVDAAEGSLGSHGRGRAESAARSQPVHGNEDNGQSQERMGGLKKHGEEARAVAGGASSDRAGALPDAEKGKERGSKRPVSAAGCETTQSAKRRLASQPGAMTPVRARRQMQLLEEGAAFVGTTPDALRDGDTQELNLRNRTVTQHSQGSRSLRSRGARVEDGEEVQGGSTTPATTRRPRAARSLARIPEKERH